MSRIAGAPVGDALFGLGRCGVRGLGDQRQCGPAVQRVRRCGGGETGQRVRQETDERLPQGLFVAAGGLGVAEQRRERGAAAHAIQDISSLGGGGRARGRRRGARGGGRGGARGGGGRRGRGARI